MTSPLHIPVTPPGLDRRALLCGGVAIAASLASGTDRAFPAAAMNAVIASIRPPAIPSRRRQLNAPSQQFGWAQDARPAIQAAIGAMHAAGGGTVVIAAGQWVCDGPIRLKSGVCLHLDEGAHLRFSGNPDSYLPPC